MGRIGIGVMVALLGMTGCSGSRLFKVVPLRIKPRRNHLMKLNRSIATVGLVLLALALLTPAPGEEPAAPKKTPLDDYIAKADPTFSWKLVQTIPGDGYTTFVV